MARQEVVVLNPLELAAHVQAFLDALAAGTQELVVQLAAGSSIVGKVGIDQTTPGTTNGVQVNAALPAGTNNIGKVSPLAAMAEFGVTELIGTNESVAQNRYCASAAVALGGTYSGEILSIGLFASEDGTGAIITEAGRLLFFDADPTVSTNDANLAAADWPTLIAAVDIAAGDWLEEAAGGLGSMVSKAVAVPFHALSTIYVAYYHQGATTWNDAAGDDEQLELNCWYRRDS